MLNEWLNAICCPITDSPLRKMNKNELDHWNKLILKKKLYYSDNRLVEKNIIEGLINDQNNIIYSIENGIPMLHINDAISDKAHLVQDTLKEDSKNFWTESPMDYFEGNLDRDFKNNEEWIEYFKTVDSKFYKKASLFAQIANQPLFSNIINYNSLEYKKVLEVGCGLGSITHQLALHGAQVVAIDQTLTAAITVKKRLEIYGLKGFVICADAENLPFRNDVFDFLWSWGVIHHTPRTAIAASQIIRVLSNGSMFNVMVYHKNALYHWYNIFFVHGILKGKLLKMTFQELRNYCSDNQCPLAQYYTKNELSDFFRSAKKITKIKAYESKDMFLSHFSFLSFFKQSNILRTIIDKIIPDNLKRFILSKWGHMLFISGKK